MHAEAKKKRYIEHVLSQRRKERARKLKRRLKAVRRISPDFVPGQDRCERHDQVRKRHRIPADPAAAILGHTRRVEAHRKAEQRKVRKKPLRLRRDLSRSWAAAKLREELVNTAIPLKQASDAVASV